MRVRGRPAVPPTHSLRPLTPYTARECQDCKSANICSEAVGSLSIISVSDSICSSPNSPIDRRWPRNRFLLLRVTLIITLGVWGWCCHLPVCSPGLAQPGPVRSGWGVSGPGVSGPSKPGPTRPCPAGPDPAWAWRTIHGNLRTFHVPVFCRDSLGLSMHNPLINPSKSVGNSWILHGESAGNQWIIHG